MRIAFLVRRYWPATGGVEILMHHVVGALAKQHEVTVIAQRVDEGPSGRAVESFRPPPPFEPFADGDARVVPLELTSAEIARLRPLALQVTPGLGRYAFGPARIPLAAWFGRIAAPAVLRAAGDADVVHMWSADLLAAAGLRAARALGAAAVITPFVHPGQWGEDPGSARAYRRADQVVGLLEAERPVFTGMGVPPEQITVCGACSPGVPLGEGAGIRAEHGIEGPLVLYLGVRRPYKGFDLLLEAAERLAARRPDVTFAFVGPGPALAPARAARVIDVGPVDEDERGAWLDAADLSCLPSEHEIFPMSVLEAFSAHTPVLLSDLPPLREIVERSGGGEVTDRTPDALADALERMLADPAALRARGDAGHRWWAESFTPEAIAGCHEQLYQRLRDARPAGAPRRPRTSPAGR